MRKKSMKWMLIFKKNKNKKNTSLLNEDESWEISISRDESIFVWKMEKWMEQ